MFVVQWLNCKRQRRKYSQIHNWRKHLISYKGQCELCLAEQQAFIIALYLNTDASAKRARAAVPRMIMTWNQVNNATWWLL